MFQIGNNRFALEDIKMNQIFEFIKSGEIGRQTITIVASIVVGVIISSFSHYIMIKKEEIVKLRAKMSNNAIEETRYLIEYSTYLHAMSIIEDHTLNDMDFEFTDNYLEINPLRGLGIVYDLEVFDEYFTKLYSLVSSKLYLYNDSIQKYGGFIQDYYLNLRPFVQGIPESKRWQLSVVVKRDFQVISEEWSTVLQKYLSRDIYNLKRRPITHKKYLRSYTEEKLNKTQLIKYKSELEKLTK